MRAAAVALAALFLAAHLAFLPASLEDLDSINFALGVRHFDVANHQPHPPGYPLFILLAKAAHAVIASEAKALGAVSVIAGTLSVFALMALFRRIDPAHSPPGSALIATLLTVTAPLYWFTASRPMSDMAGLAAALGVQAFTLTAVTPAAVAAVSFLAAFASGLRSQVAWLTVPLIVLTIARQPVGARVRTACASAGAFLAGLLAWGVPLIALTGGPRAYWSALFGQGAEDLSDIQMLWTAPTPHQLAAALYRECVSPWAFTLVAVGVVVLAIVGAVRMFRASRPAVATLAAAFVPYLLFDLCFQETVTTRYALPMVVPTAYLVMRGLGIPGGVGGRLRPAVAVALGLAMFDAQIGGTALAGYASAPAPAFQLLADMRDSRASSAGASAPVVATDRRENLDLRRPVAWFSAEIPGWPARLPAPPQHEWLELIKYWNGGGQNEVWFIADPARSDIALIDPTGRASAQKVEYRWPLTHHELLGGVRPDVMDWLRIRQPGWYLGEGWALTPETAGVAQADGRGPDRAPIEGWIRRRHEAVTLMVGGRYLSPGGAPAHVTIALDGRAIDAPTVAPGFFLRMISLLPGALDGAGGYARISVAADAHVAIEQFDAQSADRVVFGFGDGWNEAESSSALGPWRWTSDRSVLRVHAAGRALTLRLRGEPPITSLWRPARVRVSAGGRVVGEQTLFTSFDMEVRIPADLLTGDEAAITIETDRTRVPAEGLRGSPDRRRLGLRVFECDLR